MEEVVPGPKPLIFPELPVAVQVNVAPATWDKIEILLVPPEHKVCPFGLK
jgi:hypothetical protein